MSKSYTNKSLRIPFRITINQSITNDAVFDVTAYNLYPSAAWLPLRIQDAGLFYQAFRFRRLHVSGIQDFDETGTGYGLTIGLAFQNFNITTGAPGSVAQASELPCYTLGNIFYPVKMKVPDKLLLDGQVKWWQSHVSTDVDLYRQGIFYAFTKSSSAPGATYTFYVTVEGEVEFKDPIVGADLVTIAQGIVNRAV